MIKTVTAIFIALLSLNAFCAPAVETSFHFYSVSGDSLNALKKSLMANTPITSKNVKFHGRVNWNVDWHYKYSRYQGKCGVLHPEVKLRVDYHMPKITASASSEEVISQFGKYYERLLLHEHGHKDNGMRAAVDIERIMNLMPAQKTCSDLQRKVEKLIRKTIADYIEWDKKYDVDTDHGWRQGVILN